MKRNLIGEIAITIMLLSLLTGISGAAPACVADDGTAFFCGDTVTKSCTLNDSMICSLGHGLIIGANNLTIDGNSYMLDGVDPGICTWGDRSGIYNKRHDDAVIKNLEIKSFCNGIYLDRIYRNTIENCDIHHNGNATSPSATHGIKMQYVFNSTIQNNSIHDTIAYVNINPGCEDGGNGLFMYQGRYNDIIGNRFYNNTKGGILIKMKPMYNNISYNEFWENGQGGLIMRCCMCNFNLVEYNNASDNYGSGIFIGGNNNTIRYNTACNNKDNGPYYEDISVGGHGYGINIGRGDGSCFNTLISNAMCGNDHKDLSVVNEVVGNHGYENTCDTTKNYNDEETTGCTYGCGGNGGGNSGCVADDGTVYRCGDVVMKSCTLNGTLVCPPGSSGLIIGADDIIIDGASYAVIGCENATACADTDETYPELGICGILINGQYNNVTVKNFEIENFCTGVAIKGIAVPVPATNVTVCNCSIHHNGNATTEWGSTHGVHMVYANKCTIQMNSICNNTGVGCGCGDGGNGIFMYNSLYNAITCNKVCNNKKAGIFMKKCSAHNNITYNNVTGNSHSGVCIRCKMSNYNMIEDNDASDNYGSGIFVRGQYNVVRNNTINNNMNGSWYVTHCSVGGPAYYVAKCGVGIKGSPDTLGAMLYGNTVCGNEVYDMEDINGEFSGDDNTCDTTKGYNDTETTGCTYSCGTPQLLGDLNGDGKITQADAAIALQMAVRDEYSEDADVSGDHRVTSLDALMILQAAASGTL